MRSPAQVLPMNTTQLSSVIDELNYVSCVLFQIVGVMWRLSLCLLMPAVSSTLFAR